MKKKKNIYIYIDNCPLKIEIKNSILAIPGTKYMLSPYRRLKKITSQLHTLSSFLSQNECLKFAKKTIFQAAFALKMRFITKNISLYQKVESGVNTQRSQVSFTSVKINTKHEKAAYLERVAAPADLLFSDHVFHRLFSI